MHDDTLVNCLKRFLPPISFWGSLKEWEEAGSEDVRKRAKRRVKEILSEAPETLLPADVEKDLQAYMEKEIKRL